MAYIIALLVVCAVCFLTDLPLKNQTSRYSEHDYVNKIFQALSLCTLVSRSSQNTLTQRAFSNKIERDFVSAVSIQREGTTVVKLAGKKGAESWPEWTIPTAQLALISGKKMIIIYDGPYRNPANIRAVRITAEKQK